MKKEDLKKIQIGSIVEMKNAFQSFFYKVLEVPENLDDRFKVLTENGVKHYLAADFYSVSSEFDFLKVVVTKDNIHLYYEFMSDEYKRDNAIILHNIFNRRRAKISRILDMNTQEYTENIIEHFKKSIVFSDPCCLSVGLVVFGVKDTLKPIDEYIAEIKESDEYKEFIKSEKV